MYEKIGILILFITGTKRSSQKLPGCCDFLLKATLFPWHFLWDIFFVMSRLPELQGCRPSLFIQVKDSNHTMTSATKRMKGVSNFALISVGSGTCFSLKEPDICSKRPGSRLLQDESCNSPTHMEVPKTYINTKQRQQKVTIITHLWQTHIRMKHPPFCSPTY